MALGGNPRPPDKTTRARAGKRKKAAGLAGINPGRAGEVADTPFVRAADAKNPPATRFEPPAAFCPLDIAPPSSLFVAVGSVPADCKPVRVVGSIRSIQGGVGPDGETMKNILILGGAGFIGSHLADELLANGYRVRVMDNLDPQVHGTTISGPPAYLSPEVEFVQGDVRDRKAIRSALRGIDGVYHFAALVGVGQSMYDIARYMGREQHGHGCPAGSLDRASCAATRRRFEHEHLRRGSLQGPGGYDPARPGSGPSTSSPPLTGSCATKTAIRWSPSPTPETRTPTLPSIYALTKYDQETACLRIGQAYNIPTVAMRFFNVFGTRQSLSNPYTGVLAIFAARYLNNKPPLINEDGGQRRDFVSVHDVAQACRLALETPEAAGQAFNVGSGRSYSVLEVSEMLAKALNKEHLAPTMTRPLPQG